MALTQSGIGLFEGDIVTIYQDPLTEETSEGKGQLVKFINESHDMEFWYVRFIDAWEGEPLVSRFIKKK